MVVIKVIAKSRLSKRTNLFRWHSAQNYRTTSEVAMIEATCTRYYYWLTASSLTTGPRNVCCYSHVGYQLRMQNGHRSSVHGTFSQITRVLISSNRKTWMRHSCSLTSPRKSESVSIAIVRFSSFREAYVLINSPRCV